MNGKYILQNWALHADIFSNSKPVGVKKAWYVFGIIDGMIKKTLLISLAVIVVLSAGFFWYFKKHNLDDFNPLIKTRLQALVADASDGLYSLEFDSLRTDVFNSTLVMKNVRLIPDTVLLSKLEAAGKRPADVFAVTLKTIAIDGLNISDFTSNKKVDLNIVYLNEPTIEIFHKRMPGLNPVRDTSSLQTLYQRISRQLNYLFVKRIALRNIKVIQHTYMDGQNEKTTTFSKVNFQLNDVEIDSLTQYDTTRFLYAKTADITLGKLVLPTADSLYYINMDSVTIDASKKSLVADSFSILPREDKNTFTEKMPYLKERYKAVFQQVSFKEIDWWGIVADEAFSAGEAFIKNGKLEVYSNRNLSPFPGSKIGNYPHQLIMRMPFPVNIDTMKISGIDLSYEEVNPKSGMQGKLFFNNINGTVTNITNEKNTITGNHFMKVDAACTVMNSGALHALFIFDLAKATEGNFTVNVHLGAMGASAFNAVCVPLGLFKVENGNIKSLSLELHGNNYTCGGTVKFLYNDLKIDILGQDNSNGGLKKQGLVSFIANNFILNKSNPNTGESEKVETVSYKRNVHKSFFNLIWKTTLEGIYKTIGYNH